jgi:hypothetical protein
MNVELSPQIAAAVTAYAKILGCSESEFLNRYLEDKLDEPLSEDLDMRAIDAMAFLAEFAYKSREEAQRVLDWYCATAKAEALKRGDIVRIRTEVVEMGPCYSDYLESQGSESVFMVKTAICYVNSKDQTIVVTGNADLYPDDDKPEYHWSDEPYSKAEK